MRTPDRPARGPGHAWFGDVRASDVVEYADLALDPTALDGGGWWAVVAEFDGPLHAWRFAHVETHVETRVDDASQPRAATPGAWAGPPSSAWRSSMSRPAYIAAVEEVRAAVLEGEVYQANVCRVLSAPLTRADGGAPDARALGERLASGNPAPYAGGIEVPHRPGAPGVWVVSASPELGIEVVDGDISSGPIKGTARTAAALGEKDRAENVMITDLVRNDLQRICVPGTVRVVDLLAVEHHPGLVHLVSRVRGRLSMEPGPDGVAWASVLAATHPPGSVSGAPKSSALRLISRLEPERRGPYCGQIGWIDADAQAARLAIGIRTFWWSDGVLRFGTGAGITWGSDAAAEWEETELKAHRLVGLASQCAQSAPPMG